MEFTEIVLPKFVSNQVESKIEFIMDEAKLHFIEFKHSKVLAERFIQATAPFSLNKLIYDKTTKQVIWLVEAARERKYEEMHDKRIEIEADWAEVLRQ